MSLAELKALSTKRLLARLRQLHRCEESLLLSDRADERDCSVEMFKDSPEWKFAYKQLKELLA
jgi:hypothetical protein